MKAMILAAGFGTRLKRFTKKNPKPLINISYPVKIIDTVIKNLINANIKEIAVNLHYRGEPIKKYLEEKYPEIEWKFFFEKRILGTGGGILNAKSFFKDCDKFIILNSDILFFFDLKDLIKKHSGAIASLVLIENRKDKRGVYYKERKIEGFLSDRVINDKNIKIGTFTGIHILNNKIFKYLEKYKKENKIEKFSIIEVYKEILSKGKTINAIEINDYWKDIGTIKSLKEGREDYRVFKFIGNQLGDKIVKIENTFQGGSDKRVFRISSNGISRIAIISKKKEIKSLDSISRFFYDKKFPIPFIVKSADKWIITEDGGKVSLLDKVNEYKKIGKFPIRYYKKAIDYLEELFKINIRDFPYDSLYQRKEFDYENIKFDLKYYNKYYNPGGLKLSDDIIESMAYSINLELENFPKSIIHRDYQSTNILINNNDEIRIIDYQTMRIGPIIYDLASLVFDSYIPFNKKIIYELIDYFFSLDSFKNLERKSFWAAAEIRIIQNLGAFAKLGINNPFFKSKIKEAEKRLKCLVQS